MRNNITGVLLLILSACSYNSGIQSSEIEYLTVLVDKTDSMKAVEAVTGSQLESLLTASKSNMEIGAEVNIIPITDLRFNRHYNISLPPIEGYSFNELTRKKEIGIFRQKISKSLEMVKNLPVGKSSTLVMEAIFDNLNEFAKKDSASKKQLVVISDLRQKSEWFDSYDSLQLLKYSENQKLIFQLFDNKFHLGDHLKNITVLLIHEPTNLKDDQVFYLISSWLKSYLEPKGIRVHIQTNIQ